MNGFAALDIPTCRRYVVDKAGAANAAPALKYKFYFTPHFCGYTKFGIVGGADKILDYADRPSFCLYSSGLSPPRDILIRFSRYQTI